MSKSIYKQVRLTLTEERQRGTLGLVSHTLRVMVKPVDAQWNERHTVLVLRRLDCPPLSDMHAVYGALIEMLRQDPLPGSLE